MIPYHTLSFSIKLISLTSKSIHVVANGKILFFSMAELCFIIYILASSSSIHPSVDTWIVPISWQLHIMQLINIGSMYLFQAVFLIFRYIHRSGIIGLYGSSIFSFWELVILCSTEVAPIYIPINSIQGFLFLHILVNIYYLCPFDDAI